MRRRRFYLLVASVMVGCGGAPGENADAFEPTDPPDRVAIPIDTTSAEPAEPEPDESLPSDSAPLDQASPWDDARARGIDFRAIGQEPGWFLEIDTESSLLFAYDYGTERTRVPTPEPHEDAATDRTTYRTMADSLDLVIVIESEPCFDTMSGEAFDRTVTVSLGSREYRGCGRVLRQE